MKGEKVMRFYCSFLLAWVILSPSFPGFAQSVDVSSAQIALWDAVLAGDVPKVMDLVRAGADVNRLDIRTSVAGSNGRRPLNYAALQNDTTMITALLEAGALINLTNHSGFTPLHHAGEAGAKDAAALLMAQGADLTLRNRRAQTPIETALAFGHPDVAEVMRQARVPSK
jgi:ankyrin repeat protein